jgi:capsular exopolysaccharide synthesis family protein
VFGTDQKPGPDPKLNKRLVSLVAPTSFEAEQYRRLRQRIEELNVTRGVRVVVVTSSVASDGKTLTAVNLAAALARGPNARILLIDADLRQPAVARNLGLTCENGGLEAALGLPQAQLADFVRPVAGGLSVLPVAVSCEETYELLTSAKLGQLLDEAKRRYDYIIIDTPPVIPVPDATLIRRLVDGYLVVVSANSTPRKLVGEALNLLDPSAVIGLVFNRDNRPLFGYYRGYYHSYFRNYVRSVDRRFTA